jgi:hypothetical protein
MPVGYRSQALSRTTGASRVRASMRTWAGSSGAGAGTSGTRRRTVGGSLAIFEPPRAHDGTDDQMLSLLAECADRAKQLRQHGAEVVFVTGGELSLLNKGFLPGTPDFRPRGTISTPCASRPWTTPARV